jgi:hypothetical protein
MPDDLQTIITRVLARAPEWVRHDLTSPEPGVRLRAEETLAAMIEQAISDHSNA